MTGARRPLAMAERTRRVHFVGIGGIGMSGIAEVLLDLGYSVSGSDLRESDSVVRLRQLGASIRIGHHESAVEGADVVVASSAIDPSNPELVAAGRHQTPVVRRAEMLGELMRLKDGIAVAGSHGKTTTTSLLGTVLSHAGLEPTVVVGGKVNRWGSTGRLGSGSLVVAEADESDGSFLLLRPVIAVVTNIDPEHLEAYGGSVRELEDAFVRFLDGVPFFGRVVACIDDPGVRRILPRLRRPHWTYGTSPQADFRVGDLEHEGPRTRFRVEGPSGFSHRFALDMLGEHNALNACAAVAVSFDLGIEASVVAAGLKSFDGVDRRFSIRGTVNDVMVVDDYGHHPTEIRATLQGVRRAYPERRLLVGFQPHRFTRTRDLWSEFGACFDDASFVGVAPIYPAGEAPLPNVDAHRLADQIRGQGHRDCRAFSAVEELTEEMIQRVRPGDMILLLGAGDIYGWAPRLLDRLKV
jgi:UDP-N-acetylmuramate--alanine ligase